MNVVDISVTQRCQVTVVATAVRGKGSGAKEAGTKRGPAKLVVVEIDCFEHEFYLMVKEVILVNLCEADGACFFFCSKSRSKKDDAYWTFSNNSLEQIELSSIKLV